MCKQALLWQAVRRMDNSNAGVDHQMTAFMKIVRSTMFPTMSLVALLACATTSAPEYRDGDIIFHTSRSSQSEAIRHATHSPFTDMGVIFVEKGEPYLRP